MDRIQGLSTGLAVTAAALSKKRKTFSAALARQLIEFGDEYAEIGNLWLEGEALKTQGRNLSGWFVGRKQNAKARIQISRGHGKQKRAERTLEKVLAQGDPKQSGDTTTKEIPYV